MECVISLVEINKFLEFFAVSHFVLNNIFYLTHFHVIFGNILKKIDFLDSKPSPASTVPLCILPPSFMCDGRKNCDDNSDEMGCQCRGDQFECDCYQSDDGCAWTRFGCTRQWFVCDGYNHCGDGSDEKFCLNSKFYCRNDECIERSKVNDGKVDMTGGYDEFVCCANQGHECGCIPGNDNCTSSGKCIPNIWIGDARDDCVTSHSDEPCKAIKIKCENCEVITN